MPSLNTIIKTLNWITRLSILLTILFFFGLIAWDLEYDEGPYDIPNYELLTLIMFFFILCLSTNLTALVLRIYQLKF